MIRRFEADYGGEAFEVAEVADAERYCGPCSIGTASRILVIRPKSNGVEDGSCYWEAEIWECKRCGHGGQRLTPLHVTRPRLLSSPQ